MRPGINRAVSIPRLKSILLGGFFLLLAGCGTTPGHIDPGKIPKISAGMTKQEVIAAIGVPETASVDGKAETLYYVEERPWWQWVRIQVKLIDGKVVSFGEVGQGK